MTDIPIYNREADQSIALFDTPTWRPSALQRVGLVLVAIGATAFIVSWGSAAGFQYPTVLAVLMFGGLTLGGLLYAWGGRHHPAGVRTEGTMVSSTQARGAIGWVLALVLTMLYLCLYIQPDLLTHFMPVADPLSQWVRGMPADISNGGHWFLYGTFYTLAVVVMGVRAAVRYRHSRYHLIRTASVTFVQLCLAFILPQVLVRLGQPEIYPSYFWPLDWDLIFPSSVSALREAGGVGVFMLVWGTFLTLLATPVLTYFFGKRWYCSWVCGCGGLAETAGDPFRHLSPKGTRAWKIERWMVHGVLVFIILVTAIMWIAAAADVAWLDGLAGAISGTYGFWIGAMFAGVAGVGFYPVLGSRIWCRYGCPMAAILGLQQRFFSRFRITTNGGQCISCGNCSAYCEMGIDVKAYAQRGQNIVRASCVGCGICATVCPRGVLKLENGPDTSGASRAGVPVNNLIGDLEILDPEWAGA